MGRSTSSLSLNACLIARRILGPQSQRLPVKSRLLSAVFLTPLLVTPIVTHAEGVYQMGNLQRMVEILPNDTSRYIQVDIESGGEVINMNACGTLDSDDLRFTVYDSNYIQVDQQTVTDATVGCTDPMTAPLTNSVQYTAPSSGPYFISIENLASNLLYRYDITVTPNDTLNPDPTGTSGITGRVSSLYWQFLTGSFAETASTDADYFILTPGGFPNTNYVWKLDLNNFAGNGYNLKANNIGVDAPNSGFSTPSSGNSVQELYPLYINYPTKANPAPGQSASISGFRFVDDAGVDNVISPGGTVGVQDSGFFQFTTDAADSTYAIYIDVDQDGVFGNPGDVQLNGTGVPGFNSVPFDGNDNNGNPLPKGTYPAQVSVRLGEFHFVAEDAETSGGGANATGSGEGLTVFEATSANSETATLNYWDDVTVLGAGAGGTSNVPTGALSGTPEGYHTWGNFDGGGFGNIRFIDTYVYGNTSAATSDLSVSSGEDFTTATLDFTATSIPGDTLNLTVNDGDQNTDPATAQSVSVNVTNDITGETETLTLIETGPDTGIFQTALPTQFGTVAGSNSDGTVKTQNSDTLTATYQDTEDFFGDAATLTAVDTVSGGADGTVTITPTSEPGDRLTITVSDADLAGTGTLDLTVTNDVSGEIETLTLIEGVGTPGIFEGSLNTTFGTVDGPTGDNDLNTQNGDTVTVTYQDALTALGGTASVSEVSVVTGGVDGTVSISPTSFPGEAIRLTVTDADLAGTATLDVTVTNENTGEQETVTLTESSTSPGTFEGAVNSAFGTTASTDNDGALNTQSGDILRVDYEDSFTTTGSMSIRSQTHDVVGGVNGVVTLTPEIVTGAALVLSVTDADLNLDPVQRDSVSVVLTNRATGEIETVILTETTANSGVFEADVPTLTDATASNNDSGALQVTPGDALSLDYTDTRTVSGGQAAIDAPSTVLGLSISKTATLLDGGDGVANVGDRLRYSFTVENRGTATLANITLNDPLVPVQGGPLNSLPGGASNATTFFAEYTLTQADMDRGQVTNAATGAATGPQGTVVTSHSDDPQNTSDVDADGDGLASDPTITVLNAQPSLAVTKIATVDDGGDGLANPGDVLNYVFTVTNTGTVTLSNITLSDPLVTVQGDPIASLAVGETRDTHFTAQYTLTEADVAAAQVTNSASATAQAPNGDSVTGISDDPSNFADVDGDGDGNPSDPTITTFTVNQTPMGQEDSVSTQIDTPVILPVLGNDTDFENQALTVTEVTQGANGRVEIQPDGTVLYTPATGFEGSDTFDYTVCDTYDGCDTVTVTVQVRDDVPLAQDDQGATPSNTPLVLSVLANDSDPNGDPLTIRQFTAPATGTVTQNPDMTLTYAPQQNFVGVDRFTYEICDTMGHCETAEVEVRVENQTPLVTADTAQTREGEAVTVSVLGNDRDSEGALTVTAVSPPMHGAVTFTPDGTLIYAPDAGFFGIETFEYTACDVHGACDVASVTVTIGEALPNLVDDQAETEPGQAVTLSVLGNDSDPNGQALQITEVTQPIGATVTINPDGTLLVQIEDDFEGGLDFTYTACDPDGNCSQARVAVDVLAVTPDAVDDRVQTTHGVPVTLDPRSNDTDPNGDALTVTTVSLIENGTASITADGTIEIRPEPDFIGGLTARYTVCDLSGNCDTAEIFVEVNNQFPVAEPDVATTTENQPVTVAVTENDSDIEGEVVVSQVSNPVNGQVVLNADGTLSYTPNVGFYGEDVVNYTVCDSFGACVDSTLTVTVTQAVPTPQSDSAQVEPGQSVTIAVLANDQDPNGEVLRVSDVQTPLGGTVTINPDNTVEFMADPNFQGVSTFLYTVCDPQANCADARVTVDVMAVTPVATDDRAEAQSGVPVLVNPLSNDTDPNGDALSVTQVNISEGGTVRLLPDGQVEILPNAGFTGPLTVTYTVCDTDGNCDTAEILVNVTPTVSDILGTVYLDVNGDDVHQDQEPLEANWIVEILGADGTLLATVRTDAQGRYSAPGIPVGDVSIRFRNPATGVQYGEIKGLTLVGGETGVDQNMPIDPSGIVYDAVTRVAIEEAVLTLVDANGAPLPDVCFVDLAQQGQRTDANGMYRFDLVPGADDACPITKTVYTIRTVAPQGYTPGASSLIAGETLALNPPAGTGPFAVVPTADIPQDGQDTRFYLSFVLGQGDRDVINNHIPLDPITVTPTALVLTKTTPRPNVSFGDVIPYIITVTNTQETPRFNLDLIDILPPRFSYVEGSARINGVASTPRRSGRELSFPERSLAGNESLTLELALVAGPGVTEGRFINQAELRNSLDGGTLSPTAEAAVQIVPSPLFDCSEVIGKVFDDKDRNGAQSKGESGLPGVRLVTAKGLTITTDEHGRYHIACAQVPNASIGSNFILKMDERSLPTGYRVTTENPRVIRLTRGKTSKANFGSTVERVVTLDLSDAVFVQNSVKLDWEMTGHMDALILALRETQSLLRLNYHDYERLGGLAEKRLSHVERYLKSRWKNEGCCYRLVIETKLLEARLSPNQTSLSGAK